MRRFPTAPPLAWFADPQLPGPTALEITPDGRVYGHLALWGTCHTGKPGCVTAPHSSSGYRYFHLGAIETDDGKMVPCGQIAFDGPHAGLSLAWDSARQHYETCAAGADVRAGEDQFGIWVAGAVRPGLSETDLRKLRGGKLSGDWRPIGGGPEMIGALAVNYPGFPVPRTTALVASGQQVALVAAGILPDLPHPTVRQRAHIKAMAARIEGREALLELLEA